MLCVRCAANQQTCIESTKSVLTTRSNSFVGTSLVSLVTCLPTLGSTNTQSKFKGTRYILEGSNSVRLVLSPFWKGVYSKRKEFAPKGSKFFPFREDIFSEGAWCAGKQTGSWPASVAQLDARPTGNQEITGWTPSDRQHSFVEINHEIFSMVFSPFR